MRATPYGYNLDGDIQTPKFFKGLNMQKVHALRGRLIFSLCFSKNFQFAPALSVNFKKGHWFDFFYDVLLFFTGGTDDWIERDTDSLNCNMKGPKCP
jgi:hypothetical protein